MMLLRRWNASASQLLVPFCTCLIIATVGCSSTANTASAPDDVSETPVTQTTLFFEAGGQTRFVTTDQAEPQPIISEAN